MSLWSADRSRARAPTVWTGTSTSSSVVRMREISTVRAWKPVHTVVESATICRRQVRLSHKSETIADKCGSRRISPLSRRFRRQSHFCATVSLFCDSVDRAWDRPQMRAWVLRLIACPHCRRKVRHFVAEKWDCRTKVRLSHFCATVSLFCDSVDRV